jgi:hypothetical protein
MLRDNLILHLTLCRNVAEGRKINLGFKIEIKRYPGSIKT